MTAAARPRPVVIDTDPGIDDALALMLAFRSPELRVELITTVAGSVTRSWPPIAPPPIFCYSLS
jgi:hypothetical protein